MTIPQHVSATAVPPTDVEPTDQQPDEIEVLRARRAAVKDRHARGLTSLMAQRDDLRGVNALADLVDDAVRWTA